MDGRGNASSALIPTNNAPHRVDSELNQKSNNSDTSATSSETNRSSQIPLQMPLPPEQTFDSFRELEEFTHKWSLQYGFELVRAKKNKKNKAGDICIRYLQCSRHGKLSNTRKLRAEDRKRLKRASRRIDCPMSVIAAALIKEEHNGSWEIRHRGEAHCSHNHGPLDPKDLAGHRRRALTQDVLSTIHDHRAAGIRPAQTLAIIQNNSKDCILTRKDLYNARLHVP
ncbi:hypothetical protein V8E54_007568 [Elaphomyces granulatus]